MDSEAIQYDEPPSRRDEHVRDATRPSAGMPDIVLCPYCARPVAALLNRCPHCDADIHMVAPSIATFLGGTAVTLGSMLALGIGGSFLLGWLLLVASPSTLLFVYFVLKRDAAGRQRGPGEAALLVLNLIGWLVLIGAVVGAIAGVLLVVGG
jgi:hypothetical protein